MITYDLQIKKHRFLPRFIPNMSMVQEWNLGAVPFDTSLCPSREINQNFSAKTLTGETAYLSTQWTQEETSIILLDQSFFSRHGYKTDRKIHLIRNQYDGTILEAIARPTHLRLISKLCQSPVSLMCSHTIYGLLEFSNIMCTYRPDIKENTLLIPDNLWDFFMDTKIFVFSTL